MDGGPNAPTTADYAMSAASGCQKDIEDLQARVRILERQMQRLLGRLKS